MPNPKGEKHRGLYLRLVRCTDEPSGDCGCWSWNKRVTKRYPMLNIRHDGKHRSIKPHRAILVLMEVGEELEFFWDLYVLYSYAGFEADHLCFGNPRCINPDHLQWLTKEEHDAKSRSYVHPDQNQLRAARLAA